LTNRTLVGHNLTCPRIADSKRRRPNPKNISRKGSNMRRLITALAIALLAATTSYAANPHFVGAPCFNIHNTTLESCLSIAGLGNQDVTITVYANGTITRICYNPAGHAAPGQNRFPMRTTAQRSIPSTQIRNGSVDLCLTTNPPVPPACPNGNWHPVITDVSFANARIVVVQGGRTVIDQTFSNLSACP